ncbi:MAG: hypothetical protein KBS91_02065 [Firmicutes bacterium]|nr:hypothetical protein [Candidatus Caballimonas caccae]
MNKIKEFLKIDKNRKFIYGVIEIVVGVPFLIMKNYKIFFIVVKHYLYLKGWRNFL